MYKRSSIIRMVILMGLCLWGTGMYAQQKDSIKNMQKFIDLCQDYKKPQMHVSVAYSSHANIVTGEEDTAKTIAEFYTLPGSAYVKFGELEQVVSDSMAVIISDKLRRMLVYTDAATVLTQMQNSMSMALPKAAIKEMGKRYSIKAIPGANDTGILVLETRNLVFGTELSKESIELKYSKNNSLPLVVSNIKRGLVGVSESDYSSYKTMPGFKNRVFEIEGGFYALREQVITYQFVTIEYGQIVKVPVGVFDRISKHTDGTYVPVKAYGGYVLSEE